MRSTNQCTYVIKEVISYYLNNDSDVFACAFDIQKAFDRVDLVKLFTKLSNSPLPQHITRVLFTLYSSLSLSVIWNGVRSDWFKSLNGVKQGGVLSPFLFCYFINDLLSNLENLHVGCFVGCVYFGSIAYADDIVLLAPTLVALRIMLNCCSGFANDCNILFNPGKSHCIHFSSCNRVVTQYPGSLITRKTANLD